MKHAAEELLLRTLQMLEYQFSLAEKLCITDRRTLYILKLASPQIHDIEEGHLFICCLMH